MGEIKLHEGNWWWEVKQGNWRRQIKKGDWAGSRGTKKRGDSGVGTLIGAIVAGQIASVTLCNTLGI